MAKNLYAILSERIRQEKLNSGLTIEQLAEKAGISSSFLACLIVNKRKPSIDTVDKIATALNIPAAKLFEDTKSSENAEKDYFQDTASRIVLSVRPAHRKIVLSTLKELVKSLGQNPK